MKSKLLLAIGSAVLLLSSHNVLGHSEYVGLIPNGSAFSCSTCHGSSSSLNAFASDFARNGHVWNARLAQADSDGDGYTNGAELGDPAGAWTSTDPDPSGLVYNPGDPGSHPSVTVGAPPLITTPPSSQTAKVGDTVTFTVVATGSAPLTYQWLKDGLQLPAANTDTLVIAGVTAADAGRYAVIVSNSYGNGVARAALRLRRTRTR